MTVIRVKDLSLRTFIGFKPHEKKHKQDVLIQLEVEVETSMVEHNDDYHADGIYDNELEKFDEYYQTRILGRGHKAE